MVLTLKSEKIVAILGYKNKNVWMSEAVVGMTLLKTSHGVSRLKLVWVIYM